MAVMADFFHFFYLVYYDKFFLIKFTFGGKFSSDKKFTLSSLDTGYISAFDSNARCISRLMLFVEKG